MSLLEVKELCEFSKGRRAPSQEAEELCRSLFLKGV